jgi:putative DNA primase/helicase
MLILAQHWHSLRLSLAILTHKRRGQLHAFALYAMAGELAIEAGIVPWAQGAALDACKVMFEQWQLMRGNGGGATEHNQIIQNVSDYILKYGDSKFTDKNSPDDKPKIDQAGWYMDKPGGRVYLFSSTALKEAGGNYDFNRVLNALDAADWIVERDKEGLRRKKTVITGGGKMSLYWIRPDECDHA